MNRKTITLTAEQYREIISTMKQGFTGCRPNDRAATALMLEANLVSIPPEIEHLDRAN